MVVDPDLQCGVQTAGGRHKGSRCQNRLSCKIHSPDQKRAVKDRSRPFDELLSQEPANLAHLPPTASRAKRLKVVDPDAHCAVLSAEGTPCMRGLDCKQHSTEEKAQVQGRQLPIHDLLVLFYANSRKTGPTINADVECVVPIDGGGSLCRQDLRCQIHTEAQKARVPRKRPFEVLQSLQLQQRLQLFESSGGYGLAVAAATTQAGPGIEPVRKRYRRDGLQTASATTLDHGEVAEPQFQELEMGGPNLEKIRQILYDPAGTVYSPDLIEDLQLIAQRTIRPEEMCVFNEYDLIHFCFASRADFILPTFATTSEKLHDGNDVNACIISTPKAVFPFNAEGQTIVLERLRRLLERFQYPIGLFPKELKHLLLVHAIMAKPEADDDSPKMTLDVRQDVVDGKSALVMTTVQVNPSTQLPYFTNIAILHNEPIEGVVDDTHAEWFEYRGLEQACENSSLSEEQRQIRLNLVKSIAQHTHYAMVKPDQLRWLVAQLSAMYNVSLLMRGIGATNARIHPVAEELATYNQTTGLIEPGQTIQRIAPYLPTIAVHSPHAVFLVLQSLKCRFLHTKDIFVAWTDACKIADLQATYGTGPLSGPCMCTPAQAKTEFHACSSCSSMTRCSTLASAWQSGIEYRFCRRCAPPASSPDSSPSSSTDSSPADKAKPQRFKSQPGPKRRTERDRISEFTRVKTNMDKVLFPEHKLVYPDKVAASITINQEKDDAHRILRQSHSNDPVTGSSQWQDGYLTSPITETQGPMACSVEALMPLVWKDGVPREHVASNMILTKLYANQLAGSYPPIILPLLHRLDASRSEEERNMLLERIDHIHIIRSQIPWSGVDRLSSDFDRDFIEDFQRQCSTGIATLTGSQHISEQDSESSSYLWRLSRKPGWDKRTQDQLPELAAVQKFVIDLEAQMGHPIRKINDVPFPFRGGPEYQGWTWVQLYAHFASRLEQLMTNCNVRSRKTVTLPRLICAVLYLVCQGRVVQSAQLLDVPVCIYTRHPLSMSIGKIDHAKHMGTGLSESMPLLLSNFRSEECNLCVEPWHCNAAVSNRQDIKDAMQQDFRLNLRQDNQPHWSTELLPLETEVTRRYISEYVPIAGQFREERESIGLRDQQNAQQWPRVPDRCNMHNLGMTCYMSTTLQSLYAVDEYRQTVSKHAQLPYSTSTGRKDTYYLPESAASSRVSSANVSTYKQTKMADARSLFRMMDVLFGQLSKGGKKLKPTSTQLNLNLLNKIDNRYKNETEESAQLLGIYLELLVASADTSQPVSQGPLGALSDEQLARNKAGLPPAHLHTEASQTWSAFVSGGYASELTGCMFSQVIKEIACNEPVCPVIGHSFEHTAQIYLDLPAGATDLSRFNLTELIDGWQYETIHDGWKCDKDESHPRGEHYFRCFIHPATYICFAIRRGHAADETLKRSQVLPPDTLDFKHYITPACCHHKALFVAVQTTTLRADQYCMTWPLSTTGRRDRTT